MCECYTGARKRTAIERGRQQHDGTRATERIHRVRESQAGASSRPAPAWGTRRWGATPRAAARRSRASRPATSRGAQGAFQYARDHARPDGGRGELRPRQAAPHPRHRPPLGLDGGRPERPAPQRGVPQAPRGTRRARHGRGEGRRLRAWGGALREDGAELRRRVPGRGHGQRGHRAARGAGERAHPRAVAAAQRGHPPAAGLQGHAERLHARLRHPLRRGGRRLRHRARRTTWP